MPELLATMMKEWGNQFVNAKQAGKEMEKSVNQHPSATAMLNVEQMLFVNMECVHVNMDSKEIFQTCNFDDSQ